MTPDKIIPTLILITCAAIMWWQATCANRDANRAERARREAERIETRIIATQKSVRRLLADLTAVHAQATTTEEGPDAP